MKIKKTITAPYSTIQMFNLVHEIENYPKYLPWCSKTRVNNSHQIIHPVSHNTNTQMIGEIYIAYLGIKTHFITRNTNTPPSKIKMELVKGPFKHLFGTWEFIELTQNTCRIDFMLQYEFSNIILDKIFGTIFHMITNSLVDSFIKEAHHQYGNKKD